MAMFEGPDKNRNIAIAIVIAVLAVIGILYATNNLPGVSQPPGPAATTTPAR